MAGESIWTPEKCELLAKLWAEGLSCSQIAARIGGVSRNAVIGKRVRLGLPERKNPNYAGQRSRRSHDVSKRAAAKKSPAPRREPVARPKSHALFGAPEPFVPADGELVIPLNERQTVVTLENHHCRWPIGDPQEADFHFCGKSKVAGLPYCEFHARRAFRPPQEQSRRRTREEIEAEVQGLRDSYREKQKAEAV